MTPARFAMADGGPTALYDLGAALARAPLGPRPQFREELRRRLMVAAANPVAMAAERKQAATTWASSWRGRRLLISAAAGLTAITAGGGVAFAASHSLPGNPLFALKLDAEHLQYDLTSGNTARGRLDLEFAATRVRELRQLRGSGKASAVRKELGLLNSETRAGAALLLTEASKQASTDSLSTLTRFALTESSDLHALVPGLLPGLTATLRTQLTTQLSSSESLITNVGTRADTLLHKLVSIAPVAPPAPRASPSAVGTSVTSPPSEQPIPESSSGERSLIESLLGLLGSPTATLAPSPAVPSGLPTASPSPSPTPSPTASPTAGQSPSATTSGGATEPPQPASSGPASPPPILLLPSLPFLPSPLSGL